MSDRFTLFRSTFDALMALPADVGMEVLAYIGHYAMDGIEPNEQGIAYAFFCQIRPMIDKSRKKAEAGQNGGKAKRKQTEAKQKQTEANAKQTEANAKQNEAVKIKDKSIKDKKDLKDNMSDPAYPYKAVIDYLNEKAGTKYKYTSRDTRSHIKARFDEKYTLEDFYRVIDTKVAEWRGTKMEDYLRPSTLFGTKFESYLNQRPSSHNSNRFNNFGGRNYDYAELERQLVDAQRRASDAVSGF